MNNIWNKWLNQSKDCLIDPSTGPDTSSSTLDLDSFIALFAITGGASVAAVVLKLAFFFYDNRRVWKKSGGMSLNERLKELNKSFHAKKGSAMTTSSFHGVELESSRGRTPRSNSVNVDEFVVIDDEGVSTPATSPPPPPPPHA